MTEDEMVGWHHRLDAHEFEHTPGVGDGQESLVCYTRGSQRVGHDSVTKSTKQSKTCLRSSVQLSRSVVYDSMTQWTAARQVSLSIIKSQSLLKLVH